MVKIYMEHKTFEKIGNKWSIIDDFGKREITKEEYELLANEKWRGDRRTRDYTYIGYVVTKLVNIEPDYKKFKSERVFTFEEEQ